MSGLGYDRAQAERRANQRFEAKFPGTCPACDEPVAPGDVLRWGDLGAQHADCDTAIPDDSPTTDVCGRCYLHVALNGECGCD